MMKSQVNKTLLRNVIRHTDAHNKVVEEAEMWRQHLSQKSASRSQSDFRSRKESDTRSGNQSESQSKHPLDRGDDRSYLKYDSFDKKRKYARHAHMDDEDSKSPTRGERDNYWERQLLEAKEKDPDRWGHSGYKELYKEDFSSQRSSRINGSDSPLKRKKSKKSKLKKKKKKSKKRKYESYSDSDSESELTRSEQRKRKRNCQSEDSSSADSSQTSRSRSKNKTSKRSSSSSPDIAKLKRWKEHIHRKIAKEEHYVKKEIRKNRGRNKKYSSKIKRETQDGSGSNSMKMSKRSYSKETSDSERRSHSRERSYSNERFNLNKSSTKRLKNAVSKQRSYSRERIYSRERTYSRERSLSKERSFSRERTYSRERSYSNERSLRKTSVSEGSKRSKSFRKRHYSRSPYSRERSISD